MNPRPAPSMQPHHSSGHASRPHRPLPRPAPILRRTRSLSHALPALAASLLLLPAPEIPADTQTFRLAPQWNLIAFQVVPDDPSPEAVFATLPGFQAAWTFDAARGGWLRYLAPSGEAAAAPTESLANQLLSFPRIEPGRAYWIFTSQNVPAWSVSGTAPRGTDLPALELHSGWNLIGIPLGAASVTNTEPVSLLAVLTAAGFDYDALLTWENQSYRRMFRPQPAGPGEPPNPLEGLPPETPFPAFNLQSDPGRGYWIHALNPAVLRPRLVTTVRPDTDVEPLGNFPAREDINVSGLSAPAPPRSVQDQDTIRFFPGEDIQTLGIANVGDAGSGGGLLLWEAIWQPLSNPDTPEPWIRLFASPGEREVRDSQGNLLSSHTRLTGVTTLESDLVYLRLDRVNLGRGRHEGTLLLRTSVGDKSYRVVADIPGLEGDFKGHAVIHSVNGRRNPVPDIDLHVSLYEDPRIDGLLRGVIDSSQALVWPVDVPLVGHRVADAGNRFVFGGSFVLPPGDQNGEPYDRWDDSDPTAGEDVDWLDDGLLDVRNPFPFPVQRTVSFEGALVHGNPTDGYILEGDYREIVYGMSRQPIVLEGAFRLERRHPRPLATRRLTDSDTGIEPVVARRNTDPVVIPPGATRDSTLGVVTEMELQAVQVALAFNAPVPHSALLIRLLSPASPPAELVLYDGRPSADRIHPRLFQSLNFPIDRPTRGDLTAFLNQVVQTRSEPALGRLWKLSIENHGSQPVTLAHWSLRLDGQPVTDVHGVVSDGSNPLPGVRVSLDGVPFSLFSDLTDNEGRFLLRRVPLLPVNLSASRPGFGPAHPDQPGLDPRFTRPFAFHPDLALSPLERRLVERFNPLAGAPPAAAGVPGFLHGTADTPFELELRPDRTDQPAFTAGPLLASAGSRVEFHAVAPAPVRWDFGDGSTATGNAAFHSYPAAGHYRARAFSPPDSDVPAHSVEVIALPAPGRAPARPSDLRGEPTGLPAQTADTPYPAYAFQPFLIGAGVLPATRVGTHPDSGADRYLPILTPQSPASFGPGDTNALGAAYVAATPLQMTYAASFDIDLEPRLAPAGRSQPFASDGFNPLPVPGFDPSINRNALGFRDEDFNYALLADLWRNTRAGDGSHEYPQDAQNGLIVWGNTLVTPHRNYAILTFEALDGAEFTPSREDDVFHPHPGSTPLPDLATHAVATHHRITCSIGAAILTAPTPAASVQPARLRRSQPPNPLLPDLLPAPGPAAANLHYRLLTGALAAQ